MSITLEGTIVHKNLGMGAWALVTDGETYELHDAPSELKKSDLNVRVTGRVRDDIMTIAMIGPVLEVQRFEIKN